MALCTGLPLLAVLVVLVLGLALLVARGQAQQRNLLWGAVLPPGPGPATTLVVTRITGEG